MSRYVKICLCFVFLFVAVFVCSQQASAQTYTCRYSSWSTVTIIGDTYQTGLLPGEYTTPVTAVPDPGYYFRWSDGNTNATRTDLIVDRDLSFVAYAWDLYPDTVTLTVINGSGSGEHAASSAVPIVATAVIPGKTFYRWSSSGGSSGGSFSNAYDANTIFTMPEENVTVTANYVPVGEALNILVIGSSECSDTSEKAFSPVNIGAELQSILEGDPAVNTQMINVVVDDYHRSVDLPYISSYTRHQYVHTLAQHYYWPEDRSHTLENLRGEAGTDWDYVVMMDDAYILGIVPGYYAEGVNAIAKEVLSGGAVPLLLMQWPDASSSFAVSHFGEASYRVGDGAGVTVVPAGYAWDAWGSKDSSANHPTPHGAYIAAASIYSEIYNRSATNSSYSYNDGMADHVWGTVTNERAQTQYTGDYAFVSPICFNGDYDRHIDFSQQGTSTEAGHLRNLKVLLPNLYVTYADYGGDSAPNPPDNFNYGREGDGPKSYRVDPVYHRRAFGYQSHDFPQPKTISGLSHTYTIDRRSYPSSTSWYICGVKASRDIIVDNELADGGRAIPDRVMWCKTFYTDTNTFAIAVDGHRKDYWLVSSASYILTSLSGRCPMVDEPSDTDSGIWRSWLGSKIGYETAIRMCSLKGRASGFQVRPESATTTNLFLGYDTETMTVKFHLAPTSDVTVNVSIDVPGAVSFLTSTNLLFTPDTYYDRQSITFEPLPGVNYYEPFNVVFRTTSDDYAYDGLYDQWKYTVVRTPEMSVVGNGNVITNSDITPSGEDHTDFGSARAGATVTRTFTISNSLPAQADLNLTGTPAVVVSSGGEFLVTAQPSLTTISPSSTATFEIEFTPGSEGMKTGLVTIANDDYDENPYVFAIQGQGVSIVPAVNNDSGATNILDEYVTLQGTLTAGLFADVYVYWGTNNGGTTASEWDNTNILYSTADGDFTLDLSGLDFETTYYYRTFASNAAGTAWAPASSSFVSDKELMPVDNFVIHRGVITQAVGEVRTTLFNGVDYTLDPSSGIGNAFIRVIGTQLNGGGNTTDSSDEGSEANVSIPNPGNLITSVDFLRSQGSSRDMVVFWEIIEYVGPAGGANEIIVRGQGELEGEQLSVGAPQSLTGQVLNAVADADRVAVFVTGQRSAMFTADFNDAKQPVLTKGKAKTASFVSYAVVEFTGGNWKTIQRVEFTKDPIGSKTEYMEVPRHIDDLSKTFMHIQHRSDAPNLTDPLLQTLAVWFESTGYLGFWAEGDGHGGAVQNTTAAMWIIEHTGSHHPEMILNSQHLTSERAGDLYVAGPSEWTESIDAVSAMNNASIMGETARVPSHFSRMGGNSGGRVCMRISETNEVTLWMGSASINAYCWFNVVDWPKTSESADIFVLGPEGTEILDKDFLPGTDNGTHFGDDMMLYQSRTRTFAIGNRSSAYSDLLLSGTPTVRLSGVNPEDFDIVQPAATTVPVGSNVTFDITFNPQTDGYRSALVTIESNDP
ncbi:choice-of-anchor D domain-containing protein, partial [Verrucomicrobiota bacterium]